MQRIRRHVSDNSWDGSGKGQDGRKLKKSTRSQQEAEEQHKRMSTGQIVSGSPEYLAEDQQQQPNGNSNFHGVTQHHPEGSPISAAAHPRSSPLPSTSKNMATEDTVPSLDKNKSWMWEKLQTLKSKVTGADSSNFIQLGSNNQSSNNVDLSSGRNLVSKVMGLQRAPANAECDDEDPGVTALHRRFDLPKGEVLLGDYACAISKKILLQGRMYIFVRFICFASDILGHSKIIRIPLAQIVDIKKAKTAFIIPNAIEIIVHNVDATPGKEYKSFLFCSFIYRSEAFRAMNNLWYMTKGASMVHKKPSAANPNEGGRDVLHPLLPGSDKRYSVWDSSKPLGPAHGGSESLTDKDEDDQEDDREDEDETWSPPVIKRTESPVARSVRGGSPTVLDRSGSREGTPAAPFRSPSFQSLVRSNSQTITKKKQKLSNQPTPTSQPSRAFTYVLAFLALAIAAGILFVLRDISVLVKGHIAGGGQERQQAQTDEAVVYKIDHALSAKTSVLRSAVIHATSTRLPEADYACPSPALSDSLLVQEAALAEAQKDIIEGEIASVEIRIATLKRLRTWQQGQIAALRGSVRSWAGSGGADEAASGASAGSGHGSAY